MKALIALLVFAPTFSFAQAQATPQFEVQSGAFCETDFMGKSALERFQEALNSNPNFVYIYQDTYREGHTVQIKSYVVVRKPIIVEDFTTSTNRDSKTVCGKIVHVK